jgi:hypothetical protein
MYSIRIRLQLHWSHVVLWRGVGTVTLYHRNRVRVRGECALIDANRWSLEQRGSFGIGPPFSLPDIGSPRHSADDIATSVAMLVAWALYENGGQHRSCRRLAVSFGTKIKIRVVVTSGPADRSPHHEYIEMDYFLQHHSCRNINCVCIHTVNLKQNNV